MSSLRSRQVITTGLAMFSMFFGAGNIVFPLIVGQATGNMVWVAILGFLMTAVGVPFLGLVAMTLYNGNYRKFFDRMGKIPAHFVLIFIMILIGPVNAIPRCIAVSYGAMRLHIPGLSQLFFSIVSCVIIFFVTARKSRIVDLLGQLLSPLLIASLTMIIFKGLLAGHANGGPIAVAVGATEMIKYGLIQGYNTMDLLGAFFFSSIVIASLRMHFPHEKKSKVLAQCALKASIIGAGLLGTVYMGFALLASYHGTVLSGLEPEFLLGTLAYIVLGNSGGFVVSMAVSLACLTTAVTLAAVFAEFLQKEVVYYHLSYVYCLALTLVVTCAFATLQFSDIVAMVSPILIVGYPVLILFTVLNIFYKWYGVQSVKMPIVLATAGSLVWYHGANLLQTLFTHISL